MLRFIFGVSIISIACFMPVPSEIVSETVSAPQIVPPIKQVEPKKKTQMLYFGATWCPPCNKMKQLFKDPEVKKELDRLNFRMFDEAKDKEMFKIFRITKYPTTIFQAEGAISTRYTGYIPRKDLLAILRNIKD